jgi:low temperature requirement protein LtrA
MLARSADEANRASSQLELLFDLTFVIAVASLAHGFAEAIGDGNALHTLVPFLQVFFAVWWAWMNFTWFASAFDTDDVPFRLLTLLQMGGVLVLAAGVPAALEHGDYRAVTYGYGIMRSGLVADWLRAAVEDPSCRGTALRYAIGISVLQVGWLLRLSLDAPGLGPFLALVCCELAVPLWAERRHKTSWHPHHIAERYGLFAVILFGECIFAASVGVNEVVSSGGVSASLVATAAAALALVFALWWLYFLQEPGEGLAAHRDKSYVWGYGQYGLLSALAAVSAGLEAAVGQSGAVGYAVAIPVAVFLALVWALHAPIAPVLSGRLVLGGCLLILVVPALTGAAASLALIAAICAALVALTLTVTNRRPVWSYR